ncbi:MAG: sugar isomerase domain-containing protein [Bacillota bacterium]
MSGRRVFELFHRIIDGVCKCESAGIERAAGEIIERVVAGGAVHLFDTGHLVDRELVHRAGGLALWRPLRWDFDVTNPVRRRESDDSARCDPVQLVECVLDASRVAAGDVMIVSSVSGKSPVPVQVALGAAERGLFVIAVTSREYSGRLESEHPSGKRLFEVADLVLDSQAPYGDAALEVPGLEARLVPVSGIGAVTIMWALTAEVAEGLAHRGLIPSVYASINRPGTADLNRRAEERYERRGW